VVPFFEIHELLLHVQSEICQWNFCAKIVLWYFHISNEI
jgi:hypothetical protein